MNKNEIIDSKLFFNKGFKFSDGEREIIYDVMEEYAKQECIAFLWWMFNTLWINGKSIGQSGEHWYRQYSSPDKREYKTTEELYELYLLQSKQ